MILDRAVHLCTLQEQNYTDGFRDEMRGVDTWQNHREFLKFYNMGKADARAAKIRNPKVSER